MKTLVAYFSRAGQNYFGGAFRDIKEGNTSKVAKKVQSITGADIFEIVAVHKYPENYKACCDEALAEQRSNALPPLQNDIDISAYDRIILAYPCWWGTMPRPVFTFLKNHDFSGKTISPICTHEGSGMGSSEGDIKSICPTANVTKGLAIRGSNVDSCDSLLKDWI